jgi:hypothetical protein
VSAHDTTTPTTYDRNAILTTEQVAAWLQCSPRLVEGMGLPRLNIPGRLTRYSAGQVLDFLEGRKAA